MIAVAGKSHADGGTQRRGELPALSRQMPVVSAFRPGGTALSRKATCACGGGCPHCRQGRAARPKLEVSVPGDAYEQEADRVAEHVMRMPDTTARLQHTSERATDAQTDSGAAGGTRAAFADTALALTRTEMLVARQINTGQSTAQSPAPSPPAQTAAPGPAQANTPPAQTPAPAGGAAPAAPPLQIPECIGLIEDRALAFWALLRGVFTGLTTGGLSGAATGGSAALRQMASQSTPPLDRVSRAIAAQNFADAFCVLGVLSMNEMLRTLTALGSGRATLRSQIASANIFDPARVIFALDVVDMQAASTPFDCTRAPFPSLSLPDRTDTLDFLFPQGFTSAPNTFFGRRMPGNLVRGMRDRMERAQRIAKRNLCLNGRSPDWVAATPHSTAGGGWHARDQAFDLDYIANPYVMHEAGEGDLDRDLRGVYQRIAGLMLLRGSIIPDDIRTVRPVRGGSGTQRTWRRNEAITVGELYDLLRQESDAMASYFGLLRPAPAGATPGPVNTASPTTLDDYLQRFQADTFGQSHAGLGLGTTAAALRTRIAEDYLIVGGSSRQLQSLSGQTSRALGASTPPSRPGDRPFTHGQPAGAMTSRGQPDPASLRRPELGFLAMPREVVEALTEVGLAWGAIDIPGEPGDMMHFDCRLISGGCGP